jgi:hypothetical protein
LFVTELENVIPGRARREPRASPESIAPGLQWIAGITHAQRCGVWIPGLHASRLRRLTRIPE